MRNGRSSVCMTIDPKAGVAANNLAWIYLENGGSLDLALHLAEVGQGGACRTRRRSTTRSAGRTTRRICCPRPSPRCRRSLELDPKNPTTLYHLALAYEKSGDRAGGASGDDAVSAGRSELRSQRRRAGGACRRSGPSAPRCARHARVTAAERRTFLSVTTCCLRTTLYISSGCKHLAAHATRLHGGRARRSVAEDDFNLS